MKLIFANQKGGVGKTTCAYHIAHLFSKEIMTLVVDLDPQGNLTDTLLGFDDHGRQNPLKDNNNISRIFDKKSVEAIEIKENLFLIGSDDNLSSYASSMTMNNMSLVKKMLAKIEKRIGAENMVVILDTPPSLGVLTINALLAGGRVVIPLVAHRYSIGGLEELISNITSIRDEYGVDIDTLGLIFSMFNQQHTLDQKVKKELEAGDNGNLLFDVEIPATTKMRKATGEGIPVFELDEKHKSAVAYLDVFEEIKNRLKQEA